MTDVSDRRLGRHYRALECRYAVRSNEVYKNLVVPNGNERDPIHRWFHLKEGFSSGLLDQVLSDADMVNGQPFRLLDPFAGVGTAPLSALSRAAVGLSEVEAYGIERNPFLQLVAQTKVRAMMGEASDFAEFIKGVNGRVRSGDIQPDQTPELSTFSKSAYFKPRTLATLLRLKSAIETTDGSPLARDLASVCLAAVVEPASGLRRDGRALRFVKDKKRAAPLREFLTRCRRVEEDLSSIQPLAKASAHVYLGDGRTPDSVLPAGFKANLILFSPPYPNNIDYTEVYKLEAWILGLIKSQEEFRDQRLRTLRSHPSIRFPEYYAISENGYKDDFNNLLEPLVKAVPDTEDRAWRIRLLNGYFDDMLRTLHNLRQFLAPGGRLVYVVGNSLHGASGQRFLIAADLLLARLAELAGYSVDRIAIARYPKRKSTAGPLLRESVVFLRDG